MSRKRPETARRNAVIVKSAVVPFLGEEEMDFVDLQKVRKMDLAVEIHFACGWR